MATLELLSSRLISGKGVLKVPDMDESFRYYILYIDVARDPKNQYSSYEWNPPQSLYARMVFRRSGYALFDDMIRYEKQCFQYVNDYSGQTLIAVKCAYDGILQSFVNLVNGLAGTPGGLGIFVTGVTNLIEEYENLQLGWDEILFSCYTSAALLARFYGLKYDVCDPDYDDKHTPPPPPPPPPKVPPDDSITDISPPYDPDTNDDGNTQPYEGDETEETPPGVQCNKYDVVVRITSPNIDVGFVDVGVSCYGTVDGVGIDFDGSFRAYIDHHGEYAPTDEGCQPDVQRRTLFAGINETDYTVEIFSFTPVP